MSDRRPRKRGRRSKRMNDVVRLHYDLSRDSFPHRYLTDELWNGSVAPAIGSCSPNLRDVIDGILDGYRWRVDVELVGAAKTKARYDHLCKLMGRVSKHLQQASSDLAKLANLDIVERNLPSPDELREMSVRAEERLSKLRHIRKQSVRDARDHTIESLFRLWKFVRKSNCIGGSDGPLVKFLIGCLKAVDIDLMPENAREVLRTLNDPKRKARPRRVK